MSSVENPIRPCKRAGKTGHPRQTPAKLSGARDRAGRAGAALVSATVDAEGKRTFQLDRTKLRRVRQREGRYLLRPKGREPMPIASCCK